MTDGDSSPIRVRPVELILLAAGAMLCAGAAEAAQPRRFDVRPGRLGTALARFGEQAALSIGLTDPGLAQRPTRGVHGTLSVETALRRLLAGTGAGSVFMDPGTVRIVTLRPHELPLPRPAAPGRRSPPEFPPEGEIVVTASKQQTPLADLPGSAAVVEIDLERRGRSSADGTEAIIDRLPALASTHLGPGRNKLFIRGIADSSFTGLTPATVAQYLGDVRLNYAAPDPNLNLYDMKSAEVLEGPQGTLYGGASIGGIIRLIPNAPELGVTAASMNLGLGHVSHGATGPDGAAMLNLPLGQDLALRVVGYGARDPGYIDDAGRGLRDVNRTTSYGGRIALRFSASDSFIVDLGGVLQNLATRDSQYAERGRPFLTRRSSVAQPFDNDFRLGHATIRARWGAVNILSATGYVRHDLATVFDATAAGGPPSVFVEDAAVDLLSHETRLSGGDPRGTNWLVGVSLLNDTSRVRRRLGEVGMPQPILGVRNSNLEAALFGQAELPLVADLSITAGARLNYSEAHGELLGEVLPSDEEPSRQAVSFLPMVALTWRPDAKLLAFARYQEGYRPGALAITGPLTAERFRSDTISTVEAGFRYGDAAIDRLSFGLTLSAARWETIQADLIGPSGLPFTANIGDGKIFGAEAQLEWRPPGRLAIEAGMFVNSTSLDRPAPQFLDAEERELPNIAELGGRAALRYRGQLTDRLMLDASGSLRYVGRSALGIGPPLDLRQGGYLEAELGARVGTERLGLSFGVTNLANARANLFSFGNPFGIMARNQITPLRPRTIRIAVDGRF